MGKYVFGLLALALIGMLALYAFDPSYRAERATAAWERDQKARIAIEQEKAFAPVWTTVKTSLAILAVIGVGAGVFVGLLLGLRRVLLVQPDARGLVPMPMIGFSRLAETSHMLLTDSQASERARMITTVEVQGALLQRLLTAEQPTRHHLLPTYRIGGTNDV